MQHDILNTSIDYLKGVGPKRGEVLKSELGIYTYQDLLNYFPFRYIDRSSTIKVSQIQGANTAVQLSVVIYDVEELGPPRRKRLVAHARDETGEVVLVWFKGVKWIKSSIELGKKYVLFGKANEYNNKWNFNHPELELEDKNKNKMGDLQPIYHSGEKLSKFGLHSKGIENLQRNLLPIVLGYLNQTLSAELEKKNAFLSNKETFKNIHFPENSSLLKKAILRLKYEELFFLQLSMTRQKITTRRKVDGFKFEIVGQYFNEFYHHHLGFELTNAQKKVIKEFRKDLGKGKHMNRLLQGDVGSGKTMVAILTILIAVDNGFQACLMAPTEILAKQHFDSIQPYFQKLGLKVNLLTGSVKKKDRFVIHEDLENGELNLLIGTHALLEDKVKFQNLGLAVIDEQHRFGVAQRAKLWKKNSCPPHILVMTATPIPRTLAMTFYGDLDVSVIDELPPGRKSIVTRHFKDNQRLRVLSFMKQQIDLGRQVYVVYPLIEESEKMDYKDLMDGYESILRYFPRPKYQLSIVHGRMKSADKDYEMQRFAEGKTQIMVATTVIEVGVNVPNASLMVIESAERFGLSQLHQLRGRVGRGAAQSYCILMTGHKLSKERRKRMETMVKTNDGFEISEVDMKLRGPGNIEGTQQSGLMEMKIANLVQDTQIVSFARSKALEILEEDPDLIELKNSILYENLELQNKGKINWGRIS